MGTKKEAVMLTKAECKGILDRKGVAYTSKATVAELNALVEGTKKAKEAKKTVTKSPQTGEY